MHENHKNEQYFFAEETVNHLCSFLANYDNPCCLCTPTLGEALERLKKKVTILDIDERFSHLKGFRYFNLYKPEYIDEQFDIIICDPPFFNVSLTQLYRGIKLLSHFNTDQPILITYLSRRAYNIIGAFSTFGLTDIHYYPSYNTVKNLERNEISFFSNIPEEKLIEYNLKSN